MNVSSARLPGQRSRVLVGLIGSGIQASLSPALHMKEGAELGFEYRYELFDLDRLTGGAHALASVLDSAQADDFAGVNVTHPCKQTVLPLLDELSDDARMLRAVNTVVFSGGKRVGHNTDWWGFAESFRRGLDGVPIRHVVQLGAGGAGAAVGYAMLKLGAGSLEIFDIDAARMNALVATLSELFPTQQIRAVGDLRAAMASADGLVHATTTGMLKNPGLPLSIDLLTPRHWVVEIVYFPLETALLKAARAIGCRTLDGGGMAVFQAVGAFRLFTGVAPDADRMTRHFDILARRPSQYRATD
jgi:quinate/shikimate dehydrogenase (NAD+)